MCIRTLYFATHTVPILKYEYARKLKLHKILHYTFSFIFSYNVSFMIITYFIPIGLMGFTYAMIGHELWGSQSIGECTQRQLEHIKSKRRVSFKKNKNKFKRIIRQKIPFAVNDVTRAAVQLKPF